jgi:Rrf2 family transcriptional regulator, iron-sulfur cluster assembly transcription factor
VKLSTRGRYAVMAMADLARYGDERLEPVRLCEIAGRQELSLSYLEQLFAKLRRGGLVVAARGPGGGYRLARPAGETRIAISLSRSMSPSKRPAANPIAPKAVLAVRDVA